MPVRGIGGRQPGGGLVAVGVAAFAIVCCAGLPLLVAAAGSVALGAALGLGAGLAAAGLVVAAILVRLRRRRARQGPIAAAPDEDDALKLRTGRATPRR